MLLCCTEIITVKKMEEQKNKTTLLEQYDVLTAEYIRLLNDKDVLSNWGKPQLEAMYATRIGSWQVQRLQLQLRVKALKRKIELVYSAVNKEEPLDITTIELQVATELADAELQIMKQVTVVDNAKALLTNLHTPERSAELRKVFKQLAKQLHPDVNPDMSNVQLEIWYKIKDAYAVGDIDRMKALQLVYEKEISQLQQRHDDLPQDVIEVRIATLKTGIILLDQQIEDIKSSFPFTLAEQLKDDEWIAAQVGELKDEIAKLEAYEQELQQEYLDLIHTYGN